MLTGKGEKAIILLGCGVLAIVWLVWMERNKKLFETYGVAEREYMWERVEFLASLWASTSKVFRDLHYYQLASSCNISPKALSFELALTNRLLRFYP